MKRRDLFKGAASLAVAAAIPAAVTAEAPPPSDPDVPRRLDVRRGENCFDIEVRRYGEKANACVAYDLDTQTLVRYRVRHDGQFALVEGPDDVAYVTEHGGVSVHWTK